jgi:AbiV family abortive infection protein
MPIRVAQLPEGARACLENADSLIDSAVALLDAGRGRHATILFFHAIEEFGKALVLKEGIDAGREVPTGPQDSFCNHRLKVEAAKGELPAEFMTLRRAPFDPRVFDPKVFDSTDTLAEFEEKLRALYVDWDEDRGAWHPQLNVEPEIVRRSAEGLRAVMQRKRREWAL